MSDKNFSSPNNTDFVTDADLAAKRPPPNKRGLSANPYMRQLTQPSFWGFVYFTFAILFGGGIVNTLLGEDSHNAVLAIGFGLLVGAPFILYALFRGLGVQQKEHIPIYRNLIFLQDIFQAIFLVVTLAFFYLLILNLTDNLEASDLAINFGVMERNFGTSVSEGPDPRSDTLNKTLEKIPVVGEDLANSKLLAPNSNFRALLVGFINTLRVVWISLIFATLLGILVGVGLLSHNWMVRNVSKVYVEIFRNTPLLVQLFFVSRAMFSLLPTSQSADKPYDYHFNILGQEFQFYLSGLGFNYPKIFPTGSYNYYIFPLLLGIALGIWLWRWRLKVQDETGKPANTMRYFLAAVLGFLVIGVALAVVVGGKSPYAVQNPMITGAGKIRAFNPQGGDRYSPEYIGLFLSLVLYTAAFIADIVRAGIQSVPWGQIEASRAVGLNNGQTLRMITLPQALRLIIPPLTNQYLNLAKNSSLATSIGYTDLFTVGRLIANPTGQTVALFAVIMVTYLGLSLIISFFMNLLNRAMQLKER